MNSTATAAGRVATAAADSGQRWGHPYAKTSAGVKAPLHRVVDLVRELAAKGEDPIPDVLQALQKAVTNGRAVLLLMAPNQFAAQVIDSTLWQQATPPAGAGAHVAPPKTPSSARKAGTGAATSGAHLVAVKPRPAATTQAGVTFAFELLHSLVASDAASLDDPAHPAARLAVFAADAEAVFPSLGPERSFWDVPDVADGPYVPLKVSPGAVVDLVQMPGPPESTSAAPAVAPAAHAGPPSGSAVGLVAVQGLATATDWTHEKMFKRLQEIEATSPKPKAPLQVLMAELSSAGIEVKDRRTLQRWIKPFRDEQKTALGPFGQLVQSGQRQGKRSA